MMLSPVGDLFCFEGFEDVCEHASWLPWGGQSPRALTAGYERAILKAQAAKSTSDFVDPEQIDFWLPREKGPPVYRGAPLLLPFDGGHNG